VIHLIARIGIDRDNIIGYRLLDSDNNKIKDVSEAALVGALKSGTVVLGVELNHRKLKANNGIFERYPLIINNIPTDNKSSLIILFKVDGGFICSDYKGNIGKYREKDVINYAKKYGIANGKVVQTKETEFISSISGEYIRIIEETDNNKNSGDTPSEAMASNDVYGVRTEADDKYRVRESYASETLRKDGVNKIEEMEYRHFIMIMNTAYAEERDLDWLLEEEDATLIKRSVTILADNSFIVEYNSIKVIKTYNKWLKLGKCFVTAIYKEGILDRCYVHEKELIYIFDVIKRIHRVEREWKSADIEAVKSYGLSKFIHVNTFNSLKHSGYWTENKNKNKKLKTRSTLELGISRVDGCCYLIASICPDGSDIDPYKAKSNRFVTYLLKFKDLESGLVYSGKYLEKGLRRSKELSDMFEITNRVGKSIIGAYEEVGIITYILNCYFKKNEIDEKKIVEHYGLTTEELGIVHPQHYTRYINNEH